MLTVIIATHNSERALVPTLAMLVPGAMSGTVREVIVADGGSTDGTADVVDIAGCNIMVSTAPLAARLKAAATAARGSWLMFLRAGVVLDAAWVEEATRVIERAIARGTFASQAAVFRRAGDAAGSLAHQMFALIDGALRGPHPDQGLMLSRECYDRVGGHRNGAADPETELLRRIGRRRIVTLRSAAVAWHDRDS
ncbi:MAG TPA: glycosyltransferase [Xanthobacteraceae bacterium]|nr:glycosyltransferase [Xanthobacteraceae bacterium]